MLHVYFHLKTFFNDNQVNDRLTLVVILKILIFMRRRLTNLISRNIFDIKKYFLISRIPFHDIKKENS